MIKRLVLPFFIFFVLAYPIFAQMPSIGAQVFIEPGQTEKEITHWFEVLKKNGFTSCRIRMFESYMRDSKGNYDFSLFDIAFDAAKANGIKVFATIFPDTPFEDVGGIKLPKDSIHQEEIASYISHLVNHYKDHPALFAWVLINEPGLGSLPQSDYVSKALSMWQDTVQQSQLKKHEYRQVQFENQRFLMDLNTSFLSWVAKEIKKYDKKTHLHVNNHQIFQLADEYDFPSWMTFLNSLGASIHPSWHFGYFDRVDYTLAAAANCDMIASGAGKKPFWVTELQGGSNIFSGVKPISPSYEEITQWLWSSIGSGAEGIIFWSLNPRAVGIEAGEWALLNNLNRNSKRMDAAAQVANTLNNHQAFFAQAKSVKPKVNVLYTHQSMWAEKYLHVGHSQLEGRNIGASIKSALSFYQAFHEIGISVGLGEMNEYDWNRANYHGEILVLANQFAISEENWDLLKSFVAKGGFLFLEGLSGMYNEHLFNRFQKSDKYADFLGAEVAEFLTVADAFELEFEGHSLPAHLWKGELLVSDKLTTFHRQTYGKGKVTWIPSSIGLGARKSDFEPLANLLLEEMESHQTQDIGWKKYHPNMVVRRLQANRDLVEIFINKSDVVQEIQIPVAGKRSIIFGNKDALSKKSFLTIFPEEVVVVLSEDFF